MDKKWIDLDRPAKRSGGIVNFTHANDLRWAGVIDLPPWRQLSFDQQTRNDLFILRGELIDDTSVPYPNGTFLSLGEDSVFTAGSEGVRMFAYRERRISSWHPQVVFPSHREWHSGAVPGISVASLVSVAHRLMLVSWARGTRLRYHFHMTGEEIFVLEGELQDHPDRYPVGTWLRLYPGSGHAPHADTDTLLLLRNGHLRD